ncbi:MAG: hypothetical protein MZV70_71185 [Desulfobacterales bacterium]|nr:hypothetical protein [Desulfobacterales bacterium]
MADELLKLYGEKPLFTTKIAFVSNRDGNDEIYMMDYDGANPTRITFNKVKDYMPAWSRRPADDRLHLLPQPATPACSCCNIYEGKTDAALAAKGDELLGRLVARRQEAGLLPRPWPKQGNAEIYRQGPGDGEDQAADLQRRPSRPPRPGRPTGREIAFTTDRLGQGTPQIYIMDAEGSQRPQAPPSAATTTTRPPGRPTGDADRLRLPGRQRLRHLRPTTCGPTRSPS